MADDAIPNISFVMPVFNRPLFLRDAVESIFNGNFGDGDELIIVDDGSTDSTPHIIAELAAKHPEIRMMRHRFNKGSAAAGRNTAIDAANNEWIFCLDSDNVLVPGSVPALLRHAIDQSADAAAFGSVHYFRDDPANLIYTQTYKDGEITLADALSGLIWPGPSGNYLFTRSSWVRAGRQNEFVGGGIDSWTFGIRQLATGTKFVTLPGMLYKHRVGHDSAFVQEEREGLIDSKAFLGLHPFLNQLEDESVEYLFSAEGRKNWFAKLDTRPLRVRGKGAGVQGRNELSAKSQSLMHRIRYKISRLIAPPT